MNENEIEAAVDEIMEEIDNHKAAGSEVGRDTSIAFYEGIMEMCKWRIDSIRQDQNSENDE